MLQAFARFNAWIHVVFHFFPNQAKISGEMAMGVQFACHL